MPSRDATAVGLKLLDALGPLFLINLPKRSDRRREFRTQLKTIGLDLDDPRVRLFSAARPDDAGGFSSIGARGCFLSHLEVLRTANAEKLEQFIVCEDDLDFAADFADRLPQLLDELAATQWDILYAGHQGLPEPASPKSCELTRLDPTRPVRTTHFLVFRRRAIAPLIAHLEAILARPPGHPDGGPMHVDGAFSWFRANHPDMTALAVQPALGNQRPSRTDIHALRWFDRLIVIRSASGLARHLKKRLGMGRAR